MAVALEVSVQAGAPNAQNLRRAQPVALAHVQHTLDVDFTHFVE